MKFLKTIILISLISLQSIVAANDIQTEPASTKENIGFGIALGVITIGFLVLRFVVFP